MRALTVEDFARTFDAEAGSMPADVVELITRSDFRFEPLPITERDALIQEIEKAVEAGTFTPAGEGRRGAWDASWSERLSAFARADHDLHTMVPEYIRPQPILRLNREFVRANDAKFELRYFEVIRRWIFHTYLRELDPVFEFGCGSGYNLVALAQSYPEKRLVGLDWSPSAVALVEAAARTHGFRLSGRPFDFFNPDDSVAPGVGSGVLTICALEQAGARHRSFIEYLLRHGPSRVIHLEPIVDLYDSANPVDLTAVHYHQRRGYLTGFLDSLRRQEGAGRLKLRKVKRLDFGSLYHEGYTLLVWEPVRA